MNYIVKLCPEIIIKSTPVRKRWTKHLAQNIRLLSKRIEPGIKVIEDWDRLEIKLPGDHDGVTSLDNQIVDLLKRTPGIVNFSQVVPYSFNSVEQIYQYALEAWRDSVAGKTFCVRCKRSGEHDFTSVDVERYVGGGLNQNTEALGVNLKQPDITLSMEIKDDKCFLVEEKFPGLGGYPVGTQDPVLSLVSGGYDSTVASYMMMRRGLRTHFCFFNLGGKAHETGVKELSYFLWQRFASSHRVKFITVPFEGVVSEILEKVDPSYMGVILKRMMLQAASIVADRGKIQALVTGEAVAQVSSQTITNLSVIDRATDKLVLRPLITMDKREIIDLSTKIGTEDYSANIPEYCGVISVKPSASVSLDRTEMEEAKMDPAVLEAALANTRVQGIDAVMEGCSDGSSAVQSFEGVSENQQLIDIRHPSEVELRPLAKSLEVKALAIPFFKLNTVFSTLDSRVTYLLYCDKGIMSQLHAAHLMDAGHDNVGVFRPGKV